MTLSPQIEASNTTYQFGTSVGRSKRLTKLRWLHPGRLELNFYANIVDGDIPLLFGLHAMQPHKLILEINRGVVRSGILKWAQWI